MINITLKSNNFPTKPGYYAFFLGTVVFCKVTDIGGDKGLLVIYGEKICFLNEMSKDIRFSDRLEVV